MANYTGPKNRLSRREGLDLFGKGHKLRRAQVAPGQHGANMTRRPSNYGVQLREKQKVRRMYGVLEKQFRNYFKVAAANKSSTGEALLSLLETRLDNVVFRLGLFPTRSMARQMVTHGHVQVNGKKVNIASYQTRLGDIITLDSKATNLDLVKTRVSNSAIIPPAWLSRESAVGKIVSSPKRADIDSAINEQLIVEYYSR